MGCAARLLVKQNTFWASCSIAAHSTLALAIHRYWKLWQSADSIEIVLARFLIGVPELRESLYVR